MHWDCVDCAVLARAVELGKGGTIWNAWLWSSTGYSLRMGLLLFCGECEMIDKLHGTRIGLDSSISLTDWSGFCWLFKDFEDVMKLDQDFMIGLGMSQTGLDCCWSLYEADRCCNLPAICAVPMQSYQSNRNPVYFCNPISFQFDGMGIHDCDRIG